MREPKRLVSHGATEFERLLLGAMINERPSAALRSRMQQGLGLTGPFSWASNVKAMFADVADNITHSITQNVTHRGAAGKAVLGLAAGGVVAGAGIAAAIAVGTISNPMVPDSSRAPVQLTEERPTLAERPLQVEAAPSRAVETTANASADADGTASQLREEIALLDKARNALQRGARSGAEATLDDYRERFPRGLLSREAALLRRQSASKRDPRSATVRSESGVSETKQ